jgi:hypothetical protein
MIILEADNRRLTLSSKYSYLVTNQLSGITCFNVLNATDSAYATNAYLLLSNFGAEDAEVVQIQSVNNNTGVITITTPTKFAHAESTRVSILPYNQVRFFHTLTDVFDIGTAVPLTGFIDLQPSDWFTTYSDETFSTGYGWYCFYNSNTTNYSQVSNYIPYIGFESNMTEQILADFFSMLSNKELKLVTREDALSWASEAYGRMRNKLNLTNVEYSSSAITTLTLIAGQVEYDLPTDFDHLIAFVITDPTSPGSWGFNKRDIEYIPLREAYSFNGIGPRYYIRGFKLGIIPTPVAGGTYSYIYQKRATRLSLNTDEVDLPNGGEYVIKDYMLYRAFQKFQNPQYKMYLESYTNGINDMIIASVKRDANLDAWGIQRQSNV